MNPGAVVRMTSYKHVYPSGTQLGLSPKDRKYVTVFVLLGHERKDGSAPLDVEQAMNALGWFTKPTEMSFKDQSGVKRTVVYVASNEREGFWAISPEENWIAVEPVSDPQLTPKAFVDSILSACDASNWDADCNKGDYYRGLHDAYEAIQEIAIDYQTAMYEWTKHADQFSPVRRDDHRPERPDADPAVHPTVPSRRHE